MVTDINMSDFPTYNTINGSFSMTITIFYSLLRRVITNKSQVHSRAGGMGRGSNIKINYQWVV